MPENTAEFIELVRRMREAQREYFRSRSSEALTESKRLERQVDTALAAAKTPSLFGG